MPLDLSVVRSRFPGLMRDAVFLDNPAGTQVAQHVLDRVQRYLIDTNANQGGQFLTSRLSDSLLHEARAACADLYHAARPEEIVFGANMTSLTFHFSRSLAKLLSPGDTIVVTKLDHDANISPWMQIAQERGAKLEWVDFDVEDGTLRLESLEKALESRPKIVAVGYASNALGTINPVRTITSMAKSTGALVYVDAVQYAPHGVIDVRDLGCDFLVSSAYKFFSTHVGILYGRFSLLEELAAHKVRPASSRPPGKWETGTPNFEGIAGVLGALEYFEWIGDTFGKGGMNRRERLVEAMGLLRDYETGLSRHLLETLGDIPGVQVYGLTDLNRLDERVPTVSFTKSGKSPSEIATALGENGVYVWDGNYYALSVTERLGLENSGGMVRVGPVHYNTMEEIDRFGELLREI